MTITQERIGSTLTMKVAGSLNTMTAPELADALKGAIDLIDNLVLDFSELEYISSAGLRVVRGASKEMKSKGTMTVRGCNEEVREVFEMTGFSTVINIV